MFKLIPGGAFDLHNGWIVSKVEHRKECRTLFHPIVIPARNGAC